MHSIFNILIYRFHTRFQYTILDEKEIIMCLTVFLMNIIYFNLTYKKVISVGL